MMICARHSGAHASGLLCERDGSLSGAAAEQAAGRKTAKYDFLVQRGRLFQPIAADSVYFRRQPRAQLSFPAHIDYNSAL